MKRERNISDDKWYPVIRNTEAGKHRDFRFAAAVPFASGVAYVILMFFMPVVLEGLFPVFFDEYPVAMDWVFDLVIIAGFTGLYLRWRRGMADELCPRPLYSMFGWLILATVFMLMYASSEGFANILRVVMPYGLTASYDMSGTNMLMYVMLSVTIAPVAEELVFRWGIFEHMRGRFGFWVSFLVSALFFAVCHGTVMHIPVALALSLFASILYEVSGRLSWCIASHWLFNFFSMTLEFAISGNLARVSMIVMWFVIMIAMVLMYVFRDVVFGKWMRAGSMEDFEAYLEKQRKNLADGSENDKTDNEDESSF